MIIKILKLQYASSLQKESVFARPEFFNIVNSELSTTVHLNCLSKFY